MPSSTKTALEEIRAANEAHRNLVRHDGDADALLHAKLHDAYRRRLTAERLLSEAESGELRPIDLGEALLELGLALEPADRARVERLVDDRDLVARVFASQAIRVADVPAYHALAGPAKQLDIKVNRASPWPFVRWREFTELSEYEYEGDGVRYRGIHFLPGDAIFPNVNLDGNVVYSALSDPHALYSHSAIVAVLEHGGRRFPAVIETFEKGLRAVPLCVFFNERYTSYAEIYRHRSLDAERRAGITPFVLESMKRVRGYNFQSAEADERDYVACTMFLSWVYENAGLGLVPPRSTVRHPRILENLSLVDYTGLEVFLTPVDFIRNPDFDFIGVVDNNKFDGLLTRELIQTRFRDMYSSRRMEPERFPFMAPINLWAIGQIRRRTTIGRIISRIVGWDHLNLPKGPDKMIAAIGLAEHQITVATQKTLPVVAERLREHGRFRFREMLEDPAVSASLDRWLRFKWLPRVD